MLYTHHQKLSPSGDNHEFLPPISRWTSLAGISLIFTVITGISLSAWIRYNVKVKAIGSVRPIGEIRVVQPQMEGTIKNILVKANQVVKIGDVIAKLDTEELLIQKSQLENSMQKNNLQLIQIDGQIRNLENQIAAEKKVIETTVASAKADLIRNQREYQERKINTESEFMAAQASLQQARTNLEKTESDLKFAQIDRDRYGELAKIGAIGRREFEQKELILKQSKLTLESEKKALEIAEIKVESAKAAINPTNAMIMIAKERIAQETAQGKASIANFNKEKQVLLERRLQLENQLQQSKIELEKLENQMQKSDIIATSNGIILKLNARNSGQVVNPNQAIAEIVPNNVALVIKAIIPSTEINKVAVDQIVQLRVNACPYPDYGTLKGVVKNISPDVILPEENNQNLATANSYFEATIQPENMEFGNNHQRCRLQPGMDVKADIISRQETALQFMLRKAKLITDF
jgi:HlyD family secretion protein